MPSLEQRYWAKVARAGPDDEWPWLAYIDKDGYGRIRSGSRPATAHRVAYELAYGQFPVGVDVDHDCHNRDLTCRGGSSCKHRRCQNPSHLRLRTRLENFRAGRSGSGVKTHCPQNHPYDEANTRLYRGRRYCRACHKARS